MIKDVLDNCDNWATNARQTEKGVPDFEADSGYAVAMETVAACIRRLEIGEAWVVEDKLDDGRWQIREVILSPDVAAAWRTSVDYQRIRKVELVMSKED